MPLRTLAIILLGIVFPFSHVCSVPLGLNLKLPELILILLIILMMPSILKRFKEKNSVFLWCAIAMIGFPFLSLLLSPLQLDKMIEGAAAMGFAHPSARQSPYIAPTVTVIWNIFNAMTVFTAASLKKEEWHLFRKFFLGSVLFASLYGIYQGIFVSWKGWPDIPWPSDTRHTYIGQLRSSGTFIEPLNLGHFLIFVIPCFLTLSPKTFGEKLFKFFGVISSSMLMVFTFAASAVSSIFIGWGLTIVFFRSFSRKLLWIFTSCTVGFFVIVAFIPLARTHLIEKITQTFLDRASVGGSLVDRINKVESGIRVFLDFPIFGAGPGASGLLYPLYASHTASGEYDGLPFPLNEYVKLAAEVGLVGLIALLFFYYKYLKFLYNNEKFLTRPELLLFAGGTLATLVDFNFSTFLNVYYPWFFMGVSIALVRIRRAEKSGENYAT